MTINYAGLVVLIIGILFLMMAIIDPSKFIVYKMLNARSEMCVGEGNGRYFMMAYSVVMIVFGVLLMLRVFGKQEEEHEDWRRLALLKDVYDSCFGTYFFVRSLYSV